MVSPEDAHQLGTDDLDDQLEPGTAVEVLSSFNQVWVGGFRVATAAAGGYRLRRLSDGTVLPVLFTEEDVRPVW